MDELIGTYLGQFEILDLIGRGGMATVYRARQSSISRDVAVKVISKELVDSPEFVGRFEREARLIATLQHAHILPVYDFGREREIVYLAMRLVDGGSLDRRIRDRTLSVDITARLVTQIASALTYAHGEGIIHRDLKPNNILMDKSGSPYLTDFGLAKAVHSNAALTVTGQVLGTPAYMAPEQWRGEGPDPRTDIYALGVMLYEMLTGDLPFIGDTPYALMYKHLDESPPSALVKREDLPEAVNDVIFKAMSKTMADRFASADELAAAFNAAVGGPPHTTKLSVGRSTKKRAQDDDKQGVSQAADSATTLQIGMEAERTRIGSGRRKWLMIAGISVAVVALLAVAGFAFTRLTHTLEPYRQLLKLEGHKGPINAMAWSPDGTRIASASEDKTVRIWNAATGDTLFVLRGHTDDVINLAWSRGGNRLATVGQDNTIRIWSPDQGQAEATWQPPGGEGAVEIAWNPDGTKLASIDVDNAVVMWDVASGTPTTFFQGTFGSQYYGTAIAWSPDGSKLALAINSNSVTILDSKTGNTLMTIPAHTDSVLAMAWNNDSSRLATGAADGSVRTWDLTSGSAVPLLSIEADIVPISAVAWSPDGKRLSSSAGFINLGATDDLTAKIWDGETGKLLYTLEGHTKPVRQALWNTDGTRLATASLDNTLIVWSTEK